MTQEDICTSPQGPRAEQRGWRPKLLELLVVLTLGFVVRMAVTIFLPNIHHPDEIFQSLEQAHRLVFGYGVVPWEFRDGARSWLMPGLVAGPLLVADVLKLPAETYVIAVQAWLSLIGSSIAVVAFLWGATISRAHAWLAALAIVIWFDFVYFSAKALGEVVAAALLFAALYSGEMARSDPRPPRFALLGALLGAVFAIRFHLAPATALIAVWSCAGLIRARWAPLLIGVSLPLMLLALADWAAWGVPFGSILENFRANMIEGRSQVYGTSPVYWYVGALVKLWSGAIVPLACLALLGARRFPMALLTALLIGLAHSLIAHKEYRFIYPALVPVIFLCAIGTVDLVERCIGHGAKAGIRGRAASLALAVLGWVITSAVLAVGDAKRDEWMRARAGLVLLDEVRRSTACGVGLMGVGWMWTGGYYRLHKDLPIHFLTPRNAREWDPRSFNVALAGEHSEPLSAWGFERHECEVHGRDGIATVCLWARPGVCVANDATELQATMTAGGT